MYNRLLELLHKLPQPTQDKITALAQEDADRFCTKYDLTLPDNKDTAYRYYLSKRVRFAWFNQVAFEHADPIDIVDLGKIRDGYHERLTWVLNHNIQQRYPLLVKDDLTKPLEEVVI